MSHWAQFGYFHLGVYSLLLPAVYTSMAVFSCFEGTANLHCYTSCTLTTLHCINVSYPMKNIIKCLQQCEGCTRFCELL